MAEIKTQVEQAASSLEKVIAEQTARIETAVAEVSKLQTKSIAQASALFEDATRIVREQVAFVHVGVSLKTFNSWCFPTTNFWTSPKPSSLPLFPSVKLSRSGTGKLDCNRR